MAHKLYAVSDTDYCPSCLHAGHQYRRNQPEHYRLHVPKDRWPAGMQVERKPRVVVDGKVYDADKVPISTESAAVAMSEFVADLEQAMPPPVSVPYAYGAKVMRQYDGTLRAGIEQAVHPHRCECGYNVPTTSKNPASAMRMHRLHAKQHKAGD